MFWSTLGNSKVNIFILKAKNFDFMGNLKLKTNKKSWNISKLYATRKLLIG